MIEWGADVVSADIHVVDNRNDYKKTVKREFIIYSMEISFQSETLENIWTERGVIMGITIEKERRKTTLTSVKNKPAWVSY